MRERPLVSVVIPTYCHEKYLAKTLSSVLGQGVDAIEVIVLDDCSPDATTEVVRPFLKHPRVRYVRHDQNMGGKANNSLALQSGRGKYLVWLHGDDYFLPGHLHAYLDVMEAHPECALIYSPCYWVDESDRVIRLARHPGHVDFDYSGGRNEVAELLAQDNYITPSAAMFRRADLEQIDGLNPKIRAADWDLFLRLALHNSEFAFLARPSTAYRVHAEQYSRDFYASIEPLRTHLHVLDQAFQALGRRALSAHKTEIAAFLEQRVKAYSPDELQALTSEFQRGCQQLAALSGSAEPEPLPSDPLVSVIVPTKDRPELLQDTLGSVNAQTYPKWELVVVNDGGADVGDLVRELDVHGRFKYLRHPVSRGLPAARNTGIRFSRGDIFCYLDDDDTLRPEHLQTVVSALRETQAEFVYTEAEYVHEAVINGERREVARNTPCSGIEYSRERLHVSNFIPVNTWAHRRELLERAGLFDCELNAFEDWDLLLRFSRLVDFVHIPRLTVEVHMRASTPGEHMTQRERKNFPALYRKLYERYPVSHTETIAARERHLYALDKEQSQPRQEIGGYQKWAKERKVTDRDLRHYAQQMMTRWTIQPSFHFVMTHVRGQEEALADTLDSLGAQLYGGWGLSVVSNEPCPDQSFAELEMLEWLQVDGNLILEVNRLAGESGADWVARVEAGTVFEPHLLYFCVHTLHQNPGLRLLYTDEDWFGEDGRQYDPLFKPDFNLELLRAIPYMGSFVLIDREALLAAGAYGEQTGAETYDAVLRVIERFGEQVVGHIPDVLMHRQDRFQLALDQDLIAANRRASVTAHLKRCDIDGEAKPGIVFGSCFVDYACGDDPPVEIIVPVNGKPKTLELFLDSLFSQTEYPEFRVRLLARDTLEIPAALRRRDNVDVVTYPHSGIQWQEVLGLVRNAGTEYVMLMSPGAIAVQPNWLEYLVAHFQKPDVAVVAPRLVSSDKQVVGGGIITGAGSYSVGMAAFGGLALEDSGYMGRAQVAQELSAVSASCMLVRKSVFESVGGVSTSIRLPFYQAVDFCLRVRESGNKIVWTPHSTLMFIGEDQPELDAFDLDALVVRESEALCMHSLPVLANDPAYNPNLTLTGERFSVDDSFAPPWTSHHHNMSRVIGFGAGSIGSWKFRVEQPLNSMHREQVANSLVLPFNTGLAPWPSMAELERLQVDTLLMHNTMHDVYMDTMESYKRVNGAFIVFGQDDLMFALPPKNPFSKTGYKDAKKRLRRCLGIADRVVVTTEPLAEELRSMADDVQVMPNYLDEAVWGDLTSERGISEKPRVGWAGAQQHLGDLELLEEVVRETSHEVDWVFFGMCPEFLHPYVKEIHNPVSFAKYPEKLATLNLDLAVAPLEYNRFNNSKSNLRILEYGALGWPVIASDIAPYQDGPVCRVPNQARAWIKAIRARIHDLDATRAEGDALLAWVRENWWLQQHLNDWLAVLDPTGDSGVRQRGQDRAAGL